MPDTRMVKTTALVPPDMMDWLALMAQQHQCTTHEIVRRALHEWFTAHAFPYVYTRPRDAETGMRIGWQPPE